MRNEKECKHTETTPYYLRGVNGPQGIVCHECKKEIDLFRMAIEKQKNEIFKQQMNRIFGRSLLSK